VSLDDVLAGLRGHEVVTCHDELLRDRDAIRERHGITLRAPWEVL